MVNSPYWHISPSGPEIPMGFLRGNAEWFVNVFSEIRERYPAYQIAIFKITAPALRLRMDGFLFCKQISINP